MKNFTLIITVVSIIIVSILLSCDQISKNDLEKSIDKVERNFDKNDTSLILESINKSISLLKEGDRDKIGKDYKKIAYNQMKLGELIIQSKLSYENKYALIEDIINIEYAYAFKYEENTKIMESLYGIIEDGHFSNKDKIKLINRVLNKLKEEEEYITDRFVDIQKMTELLTPLIVPSLVEYIQYDEYNNSEVYSNIPRNITLLDIADKYLPVNAETGIIHPLYTYLPDNEITNPEQVRALLLIDVIEKKNGEYRHNGKHIADSYVYNYHVKIIDIKEKRIVANLKFKGDNPTDTIPVIGSFKDDDEIERIYGIRPDKSIVKIFEELKSVKTFDDLFTFMDFEIKFTGYKWDYNFEKDNLFYTEPKFTYLKINLTITNNGETEKSINDLKISLINSQNFSYRSSFSSIHLPEYVSDIPAGETIETALLFDIKKDSDYVILLEEDFFSLIVDNDESERIYIELD
jgi:hypothetical protein